MTRAVLWDIGQVVYPSPFERFDDLEPEVGLPTGFLPRGPFAPGGDADYAEVDAGAAPEPDYWRAVEAKARALVPGFDLLGELRRLGWRPRPEVVTLLDDLAASDLRLAVLTNDATAFLGPDWRSSWELADRFEVIVDSLDVGARKPDPAGYRRALAELELAPQDVLFVDDLSVNVAAARGVGLAAVRFDPTDVPASVEAVRTSVR